MSVDFPRAWQIAIQTPADGHDSRCSYRRTNGGTLCDCQVLTKHSEYMDDILQTTDGKTLSLDWHFTDDGDADNPVAVCGGSWYKITAMSGRVTCPACLEILKGREEHG